MQPPFFFCASLSFLCCFSKSKKRRKQIPIQLSPIIILSCCVRNETTRKMKIDEVESTTKKARVATHTHIKVLFFLPTLLLLLPLSLSLSRRAINAQNQSCCGSMMRSIVIGDAFFFSLSRSRVLFSLSPRDETNVFAKRTTGSRGKRER